MAMLSNQIHRWLVWLADPANDQLTSPPDPVDPPGLERLLSLGSLHTVLPTVVRNLRNLSQRCGPDSVVLTRRDGSQSRGVLDRALQSVEGELRMRTAFSLILRQQAGEITIALGDEGIGVTVIKGEEFADRLYPSASLRGFTDVDMLVGEESRDQTFGVMAELGYRSRDTRMKYDTGYGEMGFVRDGHPGGTVEIHWNLVNSPTLRRGISVEYEDLQFDSACKLTPASLLLIAAVHGAASHGFDRLQLLCDVCQAARGAAGQIDIDWLSAAARRTGSCLAVTAALDLAGRTFTAPECGQVLEQLKLPRQSGIWKLMMTPAMVLRAHATLDSPRRSIFRQMLKRSR